MLEAPERSQVRVSDADGAWTLILSLLRAGQRGDAARALAARGAHVGAIPLEVEARGPTREPGHAQIVLDPASARGYRALAPLDQAARDLLDLFVPLCTGALAEQLVVAHIAQSLDGRIATHTGASQFISGAEDLSHTHRLRAICDGVMVGARTIELDDPRLTTRLVPGAHPARIVLDPCRRLSEHAQIFRDPTARTYVIVDRERAAETDTIGLAECIPLPREGRAFRPEVVLAALRERGVKRLFIEGGGVTVSGFLGAGLLDRLHVTVAPLIIGSGISAIGLAPVEQLSQALRLRTRHFQLGADILFDCDLRSRAI